MKLVCRILRRYSRHVQPVWDLRNTQQKRFKSPIVRGLVPYAAVCVGGLANVFCTRWKELRDGVEVFSEDGEKIGQSTNAAYKGLLECSVARIAWCAPPLLLPPLMMQGAERYFKFGSRLTRIATESVIIGCIFTLT
eukprot:UN07483